MSRKLRPRGTATQGRLDFGDTTLYAHTCALADVRAGKSLPRAMLPSIQLDSPKITRKLITAWFATQMDAGYQRCMRQ